MTVTNMDSGRGPGPASDAQPLAIELSGLHKNFGSVRAVRGIDLNVASGEIVAFLGPNGAGKTSTIDVVLGLSQPTKGHVSVYGMEPRQAISRGLISAVMQTGGLLKDMTVGETARYTASLFSQSQPDFPAIMVPGRQPAVAWWRAARFRALITPRSEARTIDSLMPTPHSTRSPTSISR